MDNTEALEFIENLLEDLDELPEAAEDFANSVRGTVFSMQEWIEEHEHVTERMETALKNFQAGVDKWLHK